LKGLIAAWDIILTLCFNKIILIVEANFTFM
jgi:hypothetical protein